MMHKNEHLMKYDGRITLDAFKPKTTYETNYQYQLPESHKVYKWPKYIADVPSKDNKPPIRVDPETLVPVNSKVHLPFHLHWVPKPIVGTEPTWKSVKVVKSMLKDVQATEEKERLHAQNTRPSVLLHTAVNIDTVADKSTRDILIAYMYTSDWKKSTNEVATFGKSNGIERPEYEMAPRGRIHCNEGKLPIIPVRMRRNARKWDQEQTKNTVDPTLNFWLNTPPKETDIMATEKLVTKEVKAKISDLIQHEKLRLPYDIYNSLYAGYKAKIPYGVTLRKADLPVEHPYMSVSQAIGARFKQ